MKNISVKFSALMVPYFAMWAIGPGFFAVFLQQKGIAANETAIYSCLVSLTAAVAQPFVGYLCDKTGKAKTILSAGGIGAVLAYIWLYFLDDKISLLICSMAIGLTINAVYGFSESWLTKLDCAKLGVNFGAVRSVGSLSYAVAAAIYGRVYDAFGPVSLPIAMAIGCALLVPAAAVCPNPKVDTADRQKVNIGLVFKQLLKNKRFVLVVVCYALAVMPTGAATTYYALHVRNLGGTAGDVGLSLFILAGTEFLTMPFYKRLERKFGTEKMLIFAFFMFGVKNVCIGFSATVTMALLAAVTQGFNFAFALPGVQSYVDKITPREYAATAQLVSNTVGQIVSQILGLAICGVLTTFIPVGAALAVLSIPAFVSSVVFFAGSKKLGKV